MQEVQAERPTQAMRSGLGMLKDGLEETKEKIDQEIFTQHSYQYMMERMKKDFIAMKLKSSANDNALKNKSSVFDLEQ